MTLQSTLEGGEISSTLPFKSRASLKSMRLKPPSPPPLPSEQNVKLNTPRLAHRPISSGRSGSNFIFAQSPLSAVSSSTVPPSPKLAASINTQSTPIRRHSVPTIHNRTPRTSRSSQQRPAPSLHPFPQAADKPTSVLSHSQAPVPPISQTSPSTTDYSGPQHSPPSSSTDLLHALNYAFQMQNTASQVQNAASQTLTQLVETVIAVAQGQGLDTSIIQNYLATLPMSPSLIQQPSSSHIQDPSLHSVEKHPVSSVSDPSFKDADKSSASKSTPCSHVSSETSLPPKRKRKSLEPPLPAKKTILDSRQNQSGAHPESFQPERGIFSTKNGRPMLVFIQIDTRGRHEIVHMIKVSLRRFMLTVRCKCRTEKRRQNYSRHPQSSLRHPKSTFRFLR